MNHLSYFDPLVAAHFCNDNGRPPRFMAKAELFKVPIVGTILRGARQIPVHRGSADASSSLKSAIDALERGECIVVYPEGTITRDEDFWPMAGKTGVARIALKTGCSVIPAAQWGPQEVINPRTKSIRPFPRKTMHVWAGPAVDLDDLRDQPMTATVLREATSRIMQAVTELLAQQRGVLPPSKSEDS
jgi:1-acyl-sn-glycerol-3-phosphate acyltransferase